MINDESIMKRPKTSPRMANNNSRQLPDTMVSPRYRYRYSGNGIGTIARDASPPIKANYWAGQGLGDRIGCSDLRITLPTQVQQAPPTSAPEATATTHFGPSQDLIRKALTSRQQQKHTWKNYREFTVIKI